jgi:hypothetical protein
MLCVCNRRRLRGECLSVARRCVSAGQRPVSAQEAAATQVEYDIMYSSTVAQKHPRKTLVSLGTHVAPRVPFMLSNPLKLQYPLSSHHGPETSTSRHEGEVPAKCHHNIKLDYWKRIRSPVPGANCNTHTTVQRNLKRKTRNSSMRPIPTVAPGPAPPAQHILSSTTLATSQGL